MLRARLEGEVELDLFVDDLLLEQRRQHDRRRAGGDEPSDHLEVAGQRTGRRDDRRAQLQAEVAGGEIGHALGSSGVVLCVDRCDGPCGTVRSIVASWE